MKKLLKKVLNVWLFYFAILFLFMPLILSCGGGGGGGGGGEGQPADTTPPADVTSLSAQPGDSKVTLSWGGSTSSDLAGYKVYKSLDRGGTYTILSSSVSRSATGYEVTGLNNGTAYTFKVTAYDAMPNESSGAVISCYANPPLTDSDFVAESGMTNGGITRQATQKMTGTVPNPGGASATTYEGKAYLVINGDKIPLPATSSAGNPEISGRKIYKEGKGYFLDDADALKASGVMPEKAARASLTWIFSVTFSINAGANTLRIEVYDLNDALFARTSEWSIVGVIEPASLVVTLWWNTDKTDIDLHVSPDDGATHCYYSNPSAGGMVLDYDDVNGYGPEHITLEQASGTKTYKIKVYYYADHNDTPTTTPTTASVTAAVNGITKLSASHTLTVASHASGWGSGAHIWDAGEVEVVAPNRYTVTLEDPDLANFPTVKLTTVTVTDPNNPENPKVTGLTANNFYVVNAGKAMSPVTVTAAENVYTLTFTDIIAGKRDIFVYVYVPAQGNIAMKGGLSSTKTYGTNYALLAGLNEYPPQVVSGQWFDDPAKPTKFFVRAWSSKTSDAATGFTVDAADFTTTLQDLAGGTGRAAVTVTASGITAEGWDAAKSKYSYLLSFDRPANYLDYDSQTTKFKKEIWLSWCVQDVTEVRASLLAMATGMTNTSWESANITSYTNTSAKKATILNKIQDIAGNMKNYDLFLFHFSGHGSGKPTDGNGAQYLCAYEDGAWISVNDLKAKLDLIPNPGSGITNVFVLMDACHSGNFIGKELAREYYSRDGKVSFLRFRPFLPQIAEEAPGNLKSFLEIRDLTNLTNTFVMAAQTGTSSAWDDGTLQNGVFTYYLLEGINVGGKRVSAASANSNHDVWVTGEEAFSYLDPLVRAWVTAAHGYGPADFQSPQVQDNSAATSSMLIYNW